MTTAQISDTFTIGGDLPVHRLGYRPMYLPRPRGWGEPGEPAAAERVALVPRAPGGDPENTPPTPNH